MDIDDCSRHQAEISCGTASLTIDFMGSRKCRSDEFRVGSLGYCASCHVTASSARRRIRVLLRVGRPELVDIAHEYRRVLDNPGGAGAEIE